MTVLPEPGAEALYIVDLSGFVHRFSSKVQVDPTTGCWLWTASLNNKGYPRFTDGRKRHHLLAHRYAYEQARGPIPEGLEPDHTCRTPRCVNPAHLELVTHKENLRRAYGSACALGHPYVEMHNGKRVCVECRKKRRRESYRGRNVKAS